MKVSFKQLAAPTLCLTLREHLEASGTNNPACHRGVQSLSLVLRFLDRLNDVYVCYSAEGVSVSDKVIERGTVAVTTAPGLFRLNAAMARDDFDLFLNRQD